MPNQFTTSLWGDEGFSAILSMKSIPEILSIISRDTSPPLYNLTEHLAFQIFGTSEIVIRGLSFFYYLIAIFFVFKIGEHFWGKKIGLLAAALTFLNPFFFIYAFEGRMYSIMAAAVAASMYFFITQNWAGYVLATTVALYSHHFAIFAVFVQAIVFLKYLFLKKERKHALKIFVSFFAIGILYIPWLIPLYNQVKMVSSGFWLGTPTLADLRELIYKYLATGSTHPFAKYSLYLVFGILLLRVWSKKVWQSLFLVLWFLGPILFTWIISQKFQSIFYDRYLLYTIPAAMLILASNARRVSWVFIVVLLSSFAIMATHYFTHPTKRPFQELARFVIENKNGDDYLINWNGSSHHLWETKYYKIPAPIYIPSGGELPYFVGTALMTPEDILREIPSKSPDGYSYKRVGVITSGAVDEVNLPGYTKSETHAFGELKFIWYER